MSLKLSVPFPALVDLASIIDPIVPPLLEIGLAPMRISNEKAGLVEPGTAPFTVFTTFTNEVALVKVQTVVCPGLTTTPPVVVAQESLTSTKPVCPLLGVPSNKEYPPGSRRPESALAVPPDVVSVETPKL